jgi:glutamyl-tRNA synthetase
MNKKVITRYPPSPTGAFHIGSARTALYNFLFAKKYGGEFLVRFEDTDSERSDKQYEEDILSGLVWLGMKPEAPITRQSERTAVYKKYLEAMIASGKAYEAEENASKTAKVIRFKNPNREVVFTDLIRGDVTFNTTELGDFVIAKAKDQPLYHLTVVIDDAEMEITHVIRGEDHISNTPRQILLIEAMDFAVPLYAHLPLILATDKSKLSKRKDPVSITNYKEEGYLPEALINYMALLGWSPDSDKEIFDLESLVEAFDIKAVHKAGAVFDVEKLRWMNKKYMDMLSDEAFTEMLLPYVSHETIQDDLLRLYRERIRTFSEARDVEKEFNFLFETPTYDASLLNWKETPTEETVRHLKKIVSLLETQEDFSADAIKEALWEYAEKEGRGNVLWPIRFSLTGAEKSPDPFTVASLLGKDASITRLNNAISILNK